MLFFFIILVIMLLSFFFLFTETALGSSMVKRSFTETCSRAYLSYLTR